MESLFTHNVNGSHCNGGDPGRSCRGGFKVLMYLHIEDAEGLDHPECQSKDQEAGEQDEPGVAAIGSRRRCRSSSGPPRVCWRVHGDARQALIHLGEKNRDLGFSQVMFPGARKSV